jgi:hypothetical protein
MFFVPSQMFPNQIYHERLKSSPRVKTEYGLRVEHVQLGTGGGLIAITVERPDGITDWPLRMSGSKREGIAGRFNTIIYDNPEMIPKKIKRRVADLYRIYADDRSIVLKLLRELKDKYLIVDENGSPTTVAKTPYNVLKYGYLEGKPIHAKSADGYSVDENSESESDEALIITSPHGVGVPLLAGKFELALNLLNGKPIAEVWKRNYDLILKKLDVKND